MKILFFKYRPTNIRFTVCETPKKVLRERVNNYKNMFEMSIKENNELREFTTLEKQMLNENVSNTPKFKLNVILLCLIIFIFLYG